MVDSGLVCDEVDEERSTIPSSIKPLAHIRYPVNGVVKVAFLFVLIQFLKVVKMCS